MLPRLKVIWVAVRDSLWFTPAMLTSAAAVLAFVLVEIEKRHDWKLVDVDHWLLGGSVDGAREVLSTIAGSLMTVTGVVFSVTIVALQLASSQFTPRILRNFTADRSNQVVLGVFIATFTYTLLVLRVIRSSDGEESDAVPNVAVSLAIGMALVSIGFLIYFIHHACKSVQSSVILQRVTSEALRAVANLFPEEIGAPEQHPVEELPQPADEGYPVAASEGGYLQTVDGQALFELGKRQQLLICMAQPVGAFIVPGQPLAHVWADRPCDESTRRQICRAFIIDSERTPGDDFEFLLVEIADMAVKALSPSVNDPTTAVHCIDRLSEVLLAMGKRRPPAPVRTKDGRIHFVALPPTFESAVGVAFDQILHFGRDNPAILDKLAYTVKMLVRLLPTEREARLQEFLANLEAVRSTGDTHP